MSSYSILDVSLNTDLMTVNLAPFLAPLTGAHGMPRVEQAKLLTYRQGPRGLIEYTITDTGHTGAWIVYGKLYPEPEQAARVYEIMRSLYTNAFSGIAELGMPQPLACIPELSMLFYVPVQGQPLQYALAGSEALRYMHLAGVWLATTHQQWLLLERRIRIATLMINAAAWATLIGHMYPDQAQAAIRIADQLKEHGDKLTFSNDVPIHNDYHYGHIFVDGTLNVIDFDTMRLGDPNIDIGKFCAYLHSLACRRPDLAFPASSLQNAFLGAYARHTGWQPDERFIFFCAYACLGIAKQICSRRGPVPLPQGEEQHRQIEYMLQKGLDYTQLLSSLLSNSCLACGTTARSGAAFCVQCGAALAGPQMLGALLSLAGLSCLTCGHTNRRDALFCANCCNTLGGVCAECGRIHKHGALFCASCGHILARILTHTSAAMAEAPAEQPPALPPPNNTLVLDTGTHLQERYEIVRELGGGGQSTVYLAKDLRLQGRQVAVKELITDQLPKPSQSKAISNFNQEAAILASLNHTNLPAIMDFFSLDERLYLVMEYIDGKDLERVIDETTAPIPESQVLEWARQLCHVLSYLHSQKPAVIFRDLKPSNVMLTSDNIIKLIDFNIARIFREDRNVPAESGDPTNNARASATTETPTSTSESKPRDKVRETGIAGTPGYAPPEQMRGYRTDERSDIYSLGVTLYTLLTRHNPLMSGFNSIRSRGASPTISSTTKEAIYRATQSTPEQRFQTIDEMWNALSVGLRQIERYQDWPLWEQAIHDGLAKLDRLDAAQISSIPEDIRASALEKYVALHPEQDLAFTTDYRQIWLNRAGEWQLLRGHWQQVRDVLDTPNSLPRSGNLARNRNEEPLRQAIDALVGELQAIIGIQRLGAPSEDGQLLTTTWDVASILSEVRIAPALSLSILKRTKLLGSDLEDLRLVLSRTTSTASRIAVLILFSDDRDLESARRLLATKMRQVYAYDVIPLAYDDLFQIATARDSLRAFRSIILSQVDLTAISPFIITGPASENTFFGREQEMRHIVEQMHSTSFTIIGGRRIGKSSLLRRLHRVRLPATGFRTLYHDCSTTATFESFLAAGIRDWEPQTPDSPTTFGELFALPPSDKPLVLLLDEADKLVPADRVDGWRILNLLRALAHSGRAQIIFCGERTLREAMNDSSGPLFNFANEILLGPLDFRAVEELVTRPMKQLEIELVDEQAMVRRIYDFTSGHPNIVQRLCSRLIKRLNEHNERRITVSDVNTVIEDPVFQREDFLDTYWEAATVIEKIISLLMANDDQVRTLQTVRNAMNTRCNLHPQSGEVYSALQRLVDLRSILTRTKTGYEFAVEAFPRVVAGTMTLNDTLEIYAEEYHEHAV